MSFEFPKLENIEMGYTMIICFYPQTNNQGLGYLGITQDILGISHNVQQGSFHAAPGLLGRCLVFLLVRVEWPRLAPSCSKAICRSSVSVTYRPLDEACSAKTATVMGSPSIRCFPSCLTPGLRPRSRVGMIGCANACRARMGWLM